VRPADHAKLTAGQAHGGRAANDMLDTVGSGQTLLADAAYDSNRLRDRLAGIGAKAVIRPISRRTTPPPLDPDACRRRKRIERFLSKPKHYRAIATRYDKHDTNFLALIILAATRIWLRVYESVAERSAPDRGVRTVAGRVSVGA
jgi:transposase